MPYSTLTMERPDLDKLKQVLADSAEIAAAYLFGSAATDQPVINDLDLLLLVYPTIDKNAVYLDIVDRIGRTLTVPPDRLDILFFEVQEADPEVLYEAINRGVLLKNESPDLLTQRIESVSLYLMQNEFLRNKARDLRRENLEAFGVS